MVWLTFLIGLLLSVSPMPQFMEILRPLWLALLLAFWALALPQTVGMVTAFCLGLAEDVLYGTLLGQNALILTLITFLVLSLQQRLRMFPMWQQCLVILVIFGLAQLVQLWLSALTGNRQPTLEQLAQPPEHLHEPHDRQALHGEIRRQAFGLHQRTADTDELDCRMLRLEGAHQTGAQNIPGSFARHQRNTQIGHD
jgi:rod shape-determining protein MreD